MGRELAPDELALYRRCDEVLYYLWDPIGVSDAPSARDEYQSYLPQVFKLLIGGADQDQIADYLVTVETESMGMSSDRVRATNAAFVLIEWREWIDEGDARGTG